MPKYLFAATLTQSGVQGVMKEGGTSRREALRKAAESVGGTLEALYFAFGETDVYLMVDVPDAAAAVALSMSASASRVAGVKLRTSRSRSRQRQPAPSRASPSMKDASPPPFLLDPAIAPRMGLAPGARWKCPTAGRT